MKSTFKFLNQETFNSQNVYIYKKCTHENKY